jgi:hypothetical protein
VSIHLAFGVEALYTPITGLATSMAMLSQFSIYAIAADVLATVVSMLLFKITAKRKG